jgi:hypothetical protein
MAGGAADQSRSGWPRDCPFPHDLWRALRAPALVADHLRGRLGIGVMS